MAETSITVNITAKDLGEALEQWLEKVVPEPVTVSMVPNSSYASGWNDCVQAIVKNVQKYAEGGL